MKKKAKNLHIRLTGMEEEFTRIQSTAQPAFEFHISNKAREIYAFHESIFSIRGNVIFADFRSVRLFAHLMNQKRNAAAHPERAVRPGHLNSMGLIDEILHYVAAQYRARKNPDAFRNGLVRLEEKEGKDAVNTVLRTFIRTFSPLQVYRGEISVDAYLSGESEGTPNRCIAMEELLLLDLANRNPALHHFKELFDQEELASNAHYGSMIGSIDAFFKTQPPFGPQNQPLTDLLKAPMTASPQSLSGQLLYIKNNWGMLLNRYLLDRILSALDLIREEEKWGLQGKGLLEIPDFTLGGKEGYLYDEPERFSPDPDWMSRLVLIAKSIYVWLDQLSKKYGHPITKLDEIPDEELDLLARRGFTGLWLIGVWERSNASRKIKQICGNPEAVSSAYSIFDYVIADDLGGEDAFLNLKDRAWQRGIRLASDMVPNHMGIFSRWIIEHPDWFVQTDYPPFPGYTFTGPDLSEDSRAGIHIEDGYWERRDAAVVFKQEDKWTGHTRFIYHGNDGTSMPWNDTAQLNFLIADVRESVIQLILHVARKFPIIRFDAAMTLTRRHYQRLWFPLPGTGGDIPSRTGHSLTQEAFDALFPHEFWREVVDRVAQEVPDTLLLAEAFWLMEGYFVRTLGMHRVYNSAFMNMVKMEDNAKYRSVLKNVLEFNPEILKRFVNFMNNPDEETAVAQFGRGDKYMGAAVMMVTLPGLPMFGHGQIEGFTEKYGMEYRRAYWDESVDEHLVRRHEADIFPLLKKRHLFCGIENFVLYDFFDASGTVNENVYAYSNRLGEERALVLFNNGYDSTGGWVKTSCAMSVPGDHPGERKQIRKTLAEGLGVNSHGGYYYIFRDGVNGMEFIRSGSEIAEKGLYAELSGYQYHVFMDFEEIRDNPEGDYARLAESLQGAGVPNMREALHDMKFSPVLEPFRELIRAEHLSGFEDIVPVRDTLDEMEASLIRLFDRTQTIFLESAGRFFDWRADVHALCRSQRLLLIGILHGRLLVDSKHKSVPADRPTVLERLILEAFPDATETVIPFLDKACFGIAGDAVFSRRILLVWALVHNLAALESGKEDAPGSDICLETWRLERVLAQSLAISEEDASSSGSAALLVKILTRYAPRTADAQWPAHVAGKCFDDPDVRRYLHVHEHEGVAWFNRENFERLFSMLFAVDLLKNAAVPSKYASKGSIREGYMGIQSLFAEAAESGYRVQAFKDSLL